MLIPLPNLRHFFGKGGIPNPNKLFNFSLSYNSGAHPLYNGNISETHWRTANSDSSLKSYAYSYDALNRITAATDNTGNYNLSGITYDKMGNILSLNRQGHNVTVPELGKDDNNDGQDDDFGNMDSLQYSYTDANGSSVGNKLFAVTDNGNSNFGFKDGANATIEYVYDDNGNMISDANKGITNITYNHLNLPILVNINNGSENGNIQYVYDATGMKLEKKVVKSGASDVITSYAGNYIYKNNSLEFFNHAEGYVTKDGNGYNYVYQYKDHLGNIRLSYQDADNNGDIDLEPQGQDLDNDGIAGEWEIVEEKNYYPFGLKHKGYNDVVSANANSIGQKEKTFQGQRLDDELGLNWYTFKYRYYDGSLARFHNVDPLAEDYVYNGTYNFSENRVIDSYEREGLERFFASDGSRIGTVGDDETIRVLKKSTSTESTQNLISQANDVNLTKEERAEAVSSLKLSSNRGFASLEIAAAAFALMYNEKSLLDNKEYGAAINKLDLKSRKEGSVIKGTENNTIYLLGDRTGGDYDSVIVPDMIGNASDVAGNLAGLMHTHGLGNPEFSLGKNIGFMQSSDQAMSIKYNVPIFLSNKWGQLKRGDFHKGAKKGKVIWRKVPRNPHKKNRISYDFH